MPCDLFGLHTLKIKETDRLVALKTEIEKLGGSVEITDKSLHLSASTNIKELVSIATYHDHRMGMAFAPLALKVPIIIEDAMVVSKSYPTFWNDLESIGFEITK
jgi:3-phosphoshikimate 1-carboxyvinyltransferase